jgi:hypothetical protein
VPRGFDRAVGKEPFADRIAPRGLCRELSLGNGCAERNMPFVERMLALGEGSESGSEGWQ